MKLFVITLWLTIVSCDHFPSSKCYNFTALQNFDDKKFAGEWKTVHQAREGYDYEWLTCINDTYTLEKNGKFDILYAGRESNGNRTVVHYKATPTQKGTSKYCINDLGSDALKTLTVIDTDYTTYGVVVCCEIQGDKSSVSIGVYGRKRYISDDIYDRVKAKFESEGINLSLIKIEDRCF